MSVRCWYRDDLYSRAEGTVFVCEGSGLVNGS